MTTQEILIPYISGDGIGPDVMAATRSVIDAAVSIACNDSATVRWREILAGERAFRETGEWLPNATLEAIKSSGAAIKGPLTTPIGSGIRSLNVAIRQALDLYSCIRPVRYFEGVPSPVKEPHKINIVIFRENTEDVYRGIEWKNSSPEAIGLRDYLRSRLGIDLAEDSGLGIKPMSEFASKRLVRSAVRHAIKKRLGSVTLVHKGNIMKFTEGAFRDWGYELARAEFPNEVVIEEDILGKPSQASQDGKIIMNDRIADNMFQQILMRPEEYSVLATPNLNGDYLADACAAQVGGLGLAPGANIGDGVAVFEAVHGTAPKYAGKGVANPCALMLSGAMMLEYLGLDRASQLVIRGIEKTFVEGIMTQDLARWTRDARVASTSEFAREVIARLS